MYKLLDAPLTAHLELITSCNQKCCHCYNFWRTDKNYKNFKLSKKKIIEIISQLQENKILHVILTGGEPLLNKNTLLFAMKELRKRNISFSLNSNGTLIDEETANQFKDCGLKSILISLLSYQKEIHNYLANKGDTFSRTVNGITLCVKSGLRVSVNMVVSKVNLNQIFKTGMFVKKIGIQGFNATRVMVPQSDTNTFPQELILASDDVYKLAEQLSQLHSQGMQVDSLVPYPTCFLKNSRHFSVLGGRSCSAGKTSIAISCDGSIRSCPHLKSSYGNIFESKIENIWLKMSEWRDGSLIPKECKKCHALSKCGGGCRVTSKGNNFCGKDVIMQKPILEHKQDEVKERKLIDSDSKLKVREGCRFRQDKLLGIINTNGIQNTFVEHQTFDLLKNLWKEKVVFTPRSLKQEKNIKMNKHSYLLFLTELVKHNVLQVI